MGGEEGSATEVMMDPSSASERSDWRYEEVDFIERFTHSEVG
jgi:hypothetical protein